MFLFYLWYVRGCAAEREHKQSTELFNEVVVPQLSMKKQLQMASSSHWLAIMVEGRSFACAHVLPASNPAPSDPLAYVKRPLLSSAVVLSERQVLQLKDPVLAVHQTVHCPAAFCMIISTSSALGSQLRPSFTPLYKYPDHKEFVPRTKMCFPRQDWALLGFPFDLLGSYLGAVSLCLNPTFSFRLRRNASGVPGCITPPLLFS